MKIRSRETMEKIVDYVNRYYLRYHRSPSFGEIAEKFQMSKSVSYGYIKQMVRDGMVEYDGRTISTHRMKHDDMDVLGIPVLGSVACGIPEYSGDDPDEIMYLPEKLVGKGDQFYLLYANGDSMIGAGIDDGDLVLIHKQDTARMGDIVVAWVEGEGNTLKRFLVDGNKIVLRPENPALADIRVDECRVQGVLRLIIKRPDRYSYLDKLSDRFFS